MTAWLNIVGVPAGGVADLSPALRAFVDASETVIGPRRLLQGLNPTQKLIEWASGIDAMVAQVVALRGRPTAVLATGDPLWFGIGATLAPYLDRNEVAIHPGPSAFQLAAARLNWPLQNVASISLHGRAVELLHPHILPGNRILALTRDRTTAAQVASMLTMRGFGQSVMTLLENLDGLDERVHVSIAREFDAGGIGDFYTLGVDCVAEPDAPVLPAVPGLPDSAFISDGQLTKREVRAATLAKLAPRPGALLWDVGAGCGSIGIEWMRAARDTTTIAFERGAGRRESIAANAKALGVPGIKVVAGEAPASLAGHDAPDAVFIGGDVGNDVLFEACWAALKRGGTLVANAVTLEGELALYGRHKHLGGDLTRIEIAALDALGDSRVLRPRLPVTQWQVRKP